MTEECYEIFGVEFDEVELEPQKAMHSKEWRARKGIVEFTLHRSKNTGQFVAFSSLDSGSRFGGLDAVAVLKALEEDASKRLLDTLDIAGVMPLLREFEKHLHPRVAIRRHPAEIPEWREAWLEMIKKHLFGPEGMPRPATSETMMEVTGTLLGYNFVPHNDEGTLAHIFVQMMVDSKTFNAKCYDGKRVRLILELLE